MGTVKMLFVFFGEHSKVCVNSDVVSDVIQNNSLPGYLGKLSWGRTIWDSFLAYVPLLVNSMSRWVASGGDC